MEYFKKKPAEENPQSLLDEEREREKALDEILNRDDDWTFYEDNYGFRLSEPLCLYHV